MEASVNITKITREEELPSITSKSITNEDLKNEYHYLLAEQIVKCMLEKGLISIGEYDKIMVLNRKSFCPYLWEIMS